MTKHDTPELTYCPFCGGTPHYVQSSFPSGDYKVQVQCTGCQVITAADATRDLAKAYQSAARRWNGRTDGPSDWEGEDEEGE